MVLVNFWATSCPGCIHEMPDLVKTHKKYEARGFETVAVAMSYDPPEYVRQFSERNGLPFKIAIDKDGFIVIPEGPGLGVELNQESECIVTLGSKEGLANLANAITSPGDVVLVPNPSYPIHPYGFIIAGGSCRYVPVTPDADFLRALDRAVRHSVPKPIALVLNYPSNPTALLADLDFYGQVVDFCRHHGIWILSDLAY